MENITEEESKQFRNAIICFVINSAASKLPIKGSDLSALGGRNKKAFKECFENAQRALANTYGIYLMQVPEDKVKKYIAYSECPAVTWKEYDEQQQHELCLAFLVISFLYMTGTPVPEANLISFLEGLDISFEEEHPYFGPVKKLITETFVRQLYLKREKNQIDIAMESRFIYTLGCRSTIEFQPKDIVSLVSEIMNKPKEYFISQVKKAFKNMELTEPMDTA